MLVEVFLGAAAAVSYVSPVEVYEMMNLDSHTEMEICVESLDQSRE
jgi:hypothetical protein